VVGSIEVLLLGTLGLAGIDDSSEEDRVGSDGGVDDPPIALLGIVKRNPMPELGIETSGVPVIETLGIVREPSVETEIERGLGVATAKIPLVEAREIEREPGVGTEHERELGVLIKTLGIEVEYEVETGMESEPNVETEEYPLVKAFGMLDRDPITGNTTADIGGPEVCIAGDKFNKAPL